MRAHNPSLSGVESIEGDQETKAVFTFVLADEHNTQEMKGVGREVVFISEGGEVWTAEG